MKTIGLKPFFAGAIICIILPLSFVTYNLFRSVDLIKNSTDDMSRAAQNIYSIQDIKQELNIFRRQSLMGELKQPWERAEKRKSAEESISESLGELDRRSPSALALHADLRASISKYFLRWREATAKGVKGPRLYAATTEAYERTLDSIEELLESYIRSGKITEARALAASKMYERNVLYTGLATILLMLFGSIMLIRHLYLPIMSLTDALRHYPQRKMNAMGSRIAEIIEISKAFNGLDRRLKEMNEQRLTFLSSVAHDLKNPLAAIQMSLENLAGEIREKNHLRLLEIIGRQTLQLNRLISDLLEGTRIEAGRFTLERKLIDLRTVVADASTLFGSLNSGHRLRFRSPPLKAEVYGDPERIGQIINNLISNAIKYSPNGGNIDIDIKSDRLNATLSVADQGIGIDASELDKIFDPYHRVEKQASQIPGVGLGLATVRKLVEGHGGSIFVKSVFGEGTTFTVILPLANAPKVQSVPDGEMHWQL